MLCISDDLIYIFLGKTPGTWVSVNGTCRGIGYLPEFYFSYRLNKAVAPAYQHPFSFWNTVSLFIFLFFFSRVRHLSREACVVLSGWLTSSYGSVLPPRLRTPAQLHLCTQPFVCSSFPLLLTLSLPPFPSPHNSGRRINISQLCDVLSRRMEPNNGVSSYYSDESQGNSLHQGRTACIKYVHSIKKKKKLKNKILPTWGSELCRVYAAIPFAIQARNTAERHLGASSLEWGKGSTANKKSWASDEVSGTEKGEV